MSKSWPDIKNVLDDPHVSAGTKAKLLASYVNQLDLFQVIPSEVREYTERFALTDSDVEAGRWVPVDRAYELAVAEKTTHDDPPGEDVPGDDVPTDDDVPGDAPTDDDVPGDDPADDDVRGDDPADDDVRGDDDPAGDDDPLMPDQGRLGGDLGAELMRAATEHSVAPSSNDVDVEDTDRGDTDDAAEVGRWRTQGKLFDDDVDPASSTVES